MTIIQKAPGLKTQPDANVGHKTIQDYIKAMLPEIRKALPAVMTPERFTRITLSALSANAQLQECTPMSFLGAMMQAAQLGLEPNTPLGQAYLIPRWNGKDKRRECQFQIGYKGLIDLAYRSGEVSTIDAHTVYENDEFSYSYGLEPKLHHVPALTNRGQIIAYYALFKTKDGGYGFSVMSSEDIDAHKKAFSDAVKAGRFSPWDSNPEEMSKKTVLKKVLKYAPLKSEFVRGIAADETIKTQISDDMFSVPDVSIQAEVTIADAETGEILQEEDKKP